MKATIYELTEGMSCSDHCDSPTTVTGVTVLSNLGKMLQMLISRCLEHCDSQKSHFGVTVVPISLTTVTIDPTTVTGILSYVIGEITSKLSQWLLGRAPYLVFYVQGRNWYEN